MNRAERRMAARLITSFYDRVKKRPDDLKALQLIEEQNIQETQRRMLALTYATLRREFGFGDGRLKRFVRRMLDISEDTNGGEQLVEMGLTFDEIYREVVQERVEKKEKQRGQ